MLCVWMAWWCGGPVAFAGWFDKPKAPASVPAAGRGNLSAMVDSQPAAGNLAVSRNASAQDADPVVRAGLSERWGALAEGRGWIQSPPRRAGDMGDPPTHWRFPNLDRCLESQPARRPDFRAALAENDAVVAANAAIALARLGDSAGAGQLAAAVADRDLLLPMRCAAAEALGRLARPSPVEGLRQSIDRVGDCSRGHEADYVPELHAELLDALARHVDPADDVRFANALRSLAPCAKIASLHAWADGRRGALPEAVVELTKGAEPNVRIAAIGAIARRRSPRAAECLRLALSDGDLQVRLAAIAGLGELGGPESVAMLEPIAQDRAELIRAAAASSLLRLGVEADVLKLKADKAWRVRLVVAEGLERFQDRGAFLVAREFLDDPSPTVQLRVLASIRNWPPPQRAGLLFIAMAKNTYMTRQTAARQLADLWAPAGDFPVDGAPRQRAAFFEKHRDDFERQFGSARLAAADDAGSSPREPEAAAPSPERIEEVAWLLQAFSDPARSATGVGDVESRLVKIGPDLVPALESLVEHRKSAVPDGVYRNVLPKCDPRFAAIEELASAEIRVRRRAADRLAQFSREKPLGTLAVARMAGVVERESDALVWRGVLAAAASDAGEFGGQLACMAVGHPSPEVRRNACDYMAAHPNPRFAAVLTPALEDSSPVVIEAAARAMGLCGRLDDHGALRKLLAHANEPIRVEAATALARLGDPAGAAALERLAYSKDPTTRRLTAIAMGLAPDPTFSSALVKMLDDQYAIRLAALASLPRVTGHEMPLSEGAAEPGAAERVAYWKKYTSSARP
jgi:HEAT repeat protein